MNEFKTLINECGFTLKGASKILGVKYNTAKSWNSERRKAPESILQKLRLLSESINQHKTKEN